MNFEVVKAFNVKKIEDWFLTLKAFTISYKIKVVPAVLFS